MYKISRIRENGQFCLDIYFRVISITGSLCHDKSFFHVVHIFVYIQETRIARKYVQRENFYVHSIGEALGALNP